MTERKRLLRDFIIINAASGGAVLIMFIYMLLEHYGILPSMPCGIHEIFHIYCPGCGGTRALFELLHGQMLKSLYYNPAILLGAVLIIYYEVAVVVTIIRNNGKCYYDQKCRLVYGYLIVITLFTIVRDFMLVGMGIDMIGDFL